MYGQDFIMDKMRAAGYRISGIGECYGLSHMAIQAFFAGQMEAFYTRLQCIYDMPITDFNDDFLKLKIRRQLLLDSGNLPEAQHVNDLIVELRAFFDSTALTQRPDRYLHDEDNRPLSSKQMFRMTYPLTQSIALENPGKSVTIQANFAGAYTKAGLQQYLELFTKHAREIPFALNIICNMHSMSLMYDPDTTSWIFCDPNHLPPKEFQSAQVLADAIFDHIEDLLPIKNNTLVMGTEIMVAAEQVNNFDEKFGALKQDEAWIKLHKDQESFVDFFDLSPQKLYQNFYGENKLDLEGCDRTLLEVNGIQRRVASVVIDYALYYGIDTFINRTGEVHAWVLSILPQRLQQQLWDELSDKSKINVIQSTSDSATQLQLFQSLPEGQKATIFQQLNIKTQANCLEGFTQEKRLEAFEQRTLEDKGILFSLIDSKLFNVLYIKLSETQKKDLEEAFLSYDAIKQARILVALNRPEQLDIRYQFLNLLTREQQANILSIGPKIRFSHASDNYLLSLQFFNLLPVEQRLEVFLRMSLGEQSNFLYALIEEHPDYIPEDGHFSRSDLIKMQDDLIKKLPLESKIQHIQVATYNLSKLFQTSTAYEHPETLRALSPDKQHEVLASLIKENQQHVASTLIQFLNFDQKLDIFKSKMDSGEKSDVLLMLFNSMSEEEHMQALATIISERGETIGFYLSLSDKDFLRKSINSFSKNTQFHCLRKNFNNYFKALSLNELKAIIQNKINLTIAQRTKHRTVFDSIKVDIARAQDWLGLVELLEKLDKLFDFSPTEALDIFDPTALGSLDEQQQGNQRKSLLTLDEILNKLTLNRSQLTSLALKQVWLKIHPDKTTTSQAEFSVIQRYIQSLQVFLSMNNLVPLHSTPDIESLINDVLSGLTPTDEQFLLEKATRTILTNLLEHPETSNEFIEATKKFIETNLASHQQNIQSFTTTLKALSKAASALAHIKERRSFKQDAARYQQEVSHSLATKTTPSSVIATGMTIFSKISPSGTNASEPASEGKKKL